MNLHKKDRLRNGGLIIGAVIGLAIFVLSVFSLPTYFLERDLGRGIDRLSPDQLARAKNDIRTTLLQGIGGLVLVAGAVATWRQLRITRDQMRQNQEHTQEQLQLTRQQLQQTHELSQRQVTSAEQAQVTERFTRAVEQLASEKLDVRLGGIFSLERIAIDSPSDLNTVMEILATYVRVRSPWQPGHDFEDDLKEYKSEGTVYNADATTLKNRAPDIQAAMTVIGRRDITNKDLPTLYFGAVDLRHSSLNSADLRNADFAMTNFYHAELVEVKFDGSNLADANFNSTDLEGASFKECTLRGTYFRGAYLARAVLDDAELQVADLSGANLAGTSFRRTCLQAATLKSVQISDADFKGAVADRETTWPQGFDPIAAGITIEP